MFMPEKTAFCQTLYENSGLEDMLNDSAVRPESAKPVIDRLANARANASRIFLEMSVQLRGVLTLDQWRELVKRWDQVRRRKPADTQSPAIDTRGLYDVNRSRSPIG